MRALFALALMGCTASDAEIVDRLDLSSAAPDVTGVDVDGDTLVLSTAASGIHVIDDEGSSTLLGVERFAEAGLSSALTDIATLGDGRYVMVVPGIGLMYDTTTDTLAEHFCYEPGWGDWEVQRQETLSLAFDAVTDRLLSQPQTLTGEDPDRTDVAEFDRATGEPLAWHTLDDRKFLAGALAVTPDGIVLAEGTTLFDYALGEDTPTKRIDLAGLDVERIDGLALDGDELIVLDGANQELVWVQGW